MARYFNQSDRNGAYASIRTNGQLKASVLQYVLKLILNGAFLWQKNHSKSEEVAYNLEKHVGFPR